MTMCTSWLRLLLTSTLTLAFALAAGGRALAADDGSFERLKKAGKVIIAVDATYPPMESEGQGGKLEGYDIEFATELAARLGVKPEFQVVAWEGVIPGLFSKRYDVITSSMNITDERKKQVNFVEYARMSQLYISRKGIKVSSAKDLAGKIVAVQADTTSSEFVEKQKKSGIAAKEVRAFTSADKVFEALKAGQADVAVADEPVGRFFSKLSPNHFEITGRAIAPEPIGVAIRKEDVALAGAIQTAVDAMKKDGFMKKLSDKWFGAELGGGT